MKPTPQHDWLMAEVATGFQRLALLALESQPAADVIAGTARVWHETLSRRLGSPEAAERVRQGFDQLCATCTRWPAPADLLRAMPPSAAPQQPRLRLVASDAQRAGEAKGLAECAAVLGIAFPSISSTEPQA